MITAIGDVMREAYKRNWITTRDGNCSLRKKEVDKPCVNCVQCVNIQYDRKSI